MNVLGSQLHLNSTYRVSRDFSEIPLEFLYQNKICTRRPKSRGVTIIPKPRLGPSERPPGARETFRGAPFRALSVLRPRYNKASVVTGRNSHLTPFTNARKRKARNSIFCSAKSSILTNFHHVGRRRSEQRLRRR